MKLSVFVDVEASFQEGVRGAVVEHLRGLDPARCELFAWSPNGAAAARVCAVEAGVEALFRAFLPKPHVLLDEQEPAQWPGVTVQHPARIERAQQVDYLSKAFPDPRGIELLGSVEAIRKRPGMFVGDTATTRHMVHWALRDRLGHIEQTARSRRVAVRLLPGDTVEFVDDWPCYAVNPERLHIECTSLRNTGGELVILNALSRRFEVEVWADGTWVRAEYARGRLVRGPFTSEGPFGQGTRLCFAPDPQMFGRTDLEPSWLAERLQELSVLDAGGSLTVEHGDTCRRFLAPEGLADWVRVHAGAGVSPLRGVVRSGEERCEVAWAWREGDASEVRGWVNGVHTRSGGSHVKTLRRSLAKSAPSPGHHLVAAVHVNMPHPRFAAPLKDILDSPEVAPLVKLAVQTARYSASQAKLGKPDVPASS